MDEKPLGRKRRRPPRAVTAREFRVLDRAGRTRGLLAVEPHGQPLLSLQDRQGRSRLLVRLDEDDAPRVSLESASGPCLALAIGEAGEPRLWLYEAGSDEARVGLLVDRDGTAALHLWGSGDAGDAGVFLFVQPDGETSLGFFDGERDVPRVGLRFARGESGTISLRDASGQVVWSAPATDEPV